jgi:hypothetical protein
MFGPVPTLLVCFRPKGHSGRHGGRYRSRSVRIRKEPTVAQRKPEWFADALAPDETIEFIADAQIKGSGKQGAKRAGKTAVVSAVTGVAALVTFGVGVGVSFTAPPAYVVITNQRFILFERLTGFGKAQVGKMLADAPRDQVGARVTKGLLTAVAIHERGSDEAFMRLNLGAIPSRGRTVGELLGDPLQQT